VTCGVAAAYLHRQCSSAARQYKLVTILIAGPLPADHCHGKANACAMSKWIVTRADGCAATDAIICVEGVISHKPRGLATLSHFYVEEQAIWSVQVEARPWQHTNKVRELSARLHDGLKNLRCSCVLVVVPRASWSKGTIPW